jgi:hypothetical protein
MHFHKMGKNEGAVQFMWILQKSRGSCLLFMELLRDNKHWLFNYLA